MFRTLAALAVALLGGCSSEPVPAAQAEEVEAAVQRAEHELASARNSSASAPVENIAWN